MGLEMIEFHLDGRSGVSPYQQIVQQVRNALRLGLLREGDQLPTVKDVVAALAINPNTVLKAYRELEREGLVAARPGAGTFVRRTLGRVGAADRAGERRRARPGGHRRALRRRATRRGVGSMTNAVETIGLSRRYGRTWAVREC